MGGGGGVLHKQNRKGGGGGKHMSSGILRSNLEILICHLAATWLYKSSHKTNELGCLQWQWEVLPHVQRIGGGGKSDLFLRS